MSPSSKSSIVSAMRWGFIGAVTLVAGVVGASGCLDRPLCAAVNSDPDDPKVKQNTVAQFPEGSSGDCNPKTTNVFVDAIQQTSVDKIDLLFMIDNSISMADKQEILQQAVPDLVKRLVNPVCVNTETGELGPTPATIDENCQAPYTREFNPIRDIHIGVVSSSLGGYGSEACVGTEEQDDGGRMIGARPRALSLGLADKVEGTPGFLVWDVTNGKQQDSDGLSRQFAELVKVTGEHGCGYEASLEAWYRFLVDPAPPQQIVAVQCPNSPNLCAQAQGIDQALLTQRNLFLRSDSLLAVVMLSDENDCSIQGTGQLYYAARNIDLPKPSSTCATNPNDKCCYSCAFSVPEGCSPDPVCDGSSVPADQDNRNLRCWNQKQRFGVDFLYPVQRYVNALSQSQICPEKANLSMDGGCNQPAANPIFQDLSGAGGAIRPPSLVFLAGIVGVPWQDIAADVDKDGNPWGPLDTDGDQIVDNLHFLTAQQMAGTAGDMIQRNTWLDILGEPEASPPVEPLDKLMLETKFARSGTNPATGSALAGSNAGPLANPVNGHEWDVLGNDDLQYACIFRLPTPKDCEVEYKAGHGCDCIDGDGYTIDQAHNPLCQDDSGNYSKVQYYAKGYPGLRFLQVLRDFGDNSIVASICPAVADQSQNASPSYGYRPAIGALVDRLKEALQGKCLPREIAVTPEGTVPCSIVEAIPRSVAQAPSCDSAGRTRPDPLVIEPSLRRLEEQGQCGGTGQPGCNQNDWVLCEIKESAADNNGDSKADCLQDGVNQTDVGWCYVDPAKGSGDDSLVEKCPPNQKRILRFVGEDTPAKGATVLIACLGADLGQ